MKFNIKDRPAVVLANDEFPIATIVQNLFGIASFVEQGTPTIDECAHKMSELHADTER